MLHQHNDTLLRLEAASKSAYSYALGITVGLGGILCFLNGMLLLCLCQKRSSRKRNASQCEPTTSIGNNNNLFLHYFFSFFFVLQILTTFLYRFSASAADYLASSQPPTPQVHFHSSSLSRTTTMPRGQRAAVMLTSGSGQQNQYRTFHATRYVTYVRT